MSHEGRREGERWSNVSDGSGLSLNDSVTARSMVQLLELCRTKRTQVRCSMRRLPVEGESGTLKRHGTRHAFARQSAREDGNDEHGCRAWRICRRRRTAKCSRSRSSTTAMIAGTRRPRWIRLARRWRRSLESGISNVEWRIQPATARVVDLATRHSKSAIRESVSSLSSRSRASSAHRYTSSPGIASSGVCTPARHFPARLQQACDRQASSPIVRIIALMSCASS